MANYQDNRVICSKETAEILKSDGKDNYFSPVDFSKALGVPPYSKYSYTIDYSWGCEVEERPDGLVDIGFCSRNYTDIKTIIDFISKYHEAEWWIRHQWVDIYHYYWDNGVVVEDTHKITEEEEEELSEVWNKYFDDAWLVFDSITSSDGPELNLQN